MNKKKKDSVLDVLGVILELLLAAALIAALVYKWPIHHKKVPTGMELTSSSAVMSSGSESEDVPSQAEELFFEEKSVTLCVGEEFEILYSVPEGTVYDSIVFESDSSAIVDTEENVLIANAAGKTVVRGVLNSGAKAEIAVEVLAEPEQVTLSRSEIVLLVGEEIEVSCLTDPLGLAPVSIEAGESVDLSFDEAKETEEGLSETVISIKAVFPGETVLSATLYNGLKAECVIKVVERTNAAYLENFEVIYQWPELPTGCEVTALTMAMRYLGFDLEKTEMANNYLPYTWNFIADVRYYFLGHPTDSESAGCYAPCIVTTAENYFEAKELTEEWSVLDLTGSDPQVLYDYVAKGTPVVVWVTSGMKEPYVNYYCYSEDGEAIPWMFPEHCAVLIGYDKENGTVEIADSEVGVIRTSTIDHFELIYEMMMKQAVVVVKN